MDNADFAMKAKEKLVPLKEGEVVEYTSSLRGNLGDQND
jgi:hypothetical protein